MSEIVFDISDYFPNWSYAQTHWLKSETVSGGSAGWKFALFGDKAPASFDVAEVDPATFAPTEVVDNYRWTNDVILSLGSEFPDGRSAVHPPLASYKRLMRQSDLPLGLSTATCSSVSRYLGTFGQGLQGLIPVYFPGGQQHITINTMASWKDPGNGEPPFFYGRSDLFVWSPPGTWTLAWYEEFYLSNLVPVEGSLLTAPGLRRFIHTNIVNGQPVVFTDRMFRWHPLL